MVWPQTISLLLLPLSLTSGSDFRHSHPSSLAVPPMGQPILASRLFTALPTVWCALSPVSLDLFLHIVQCSGQTLPLREPNVAITSITLFSVSSSQTLSISEIVLFIDMFICFYVLHPHLFSAVSVIKGRNFIFIFTLRHVIKFSNNIVGRNELNLGKSSIFLPWCRLCLIWPLSGTLFPEIPIVFPFWGFQPQCLPDPPFLRILLI